LYSSTNAIRVTSEDDIARGTSAGGERVLVGNLKEAGHLEEVGVGDVILKRILKKWVGRLLPDLGQDRDKWQVVA
jgi:hypothetical protein